MHQGVWGGETGKETERPDAMCMNTPQQRYLQDNRLITSDLSSLHVPPLSLPYCPRISAYMGLQFQIIS